MFVFRGIPNLGFVIEVIEFSFLYSLPYKGIISWTSADGFGRFKNEKCVRIYIRICVFQSVCLYDGPFLISQQKDGCLVIG